MKRLFTPSGFATVFITCWLIAVYFLWQQTPDLFDYAKFLLLGIVGAIFANSTGAGGGVVFIPFFNQLGVLEVQAIASSFAIQSFGMTAGAIVWGRYFTTAVQPQPYQQMTRKIVLLCALPSLAGLWLTYFFGLTAPGSLHTSFAWFSIILGSALLLSLRRPTGVESHTLTQTEKLALVLTCLAGGMITAWLSVGVGELIALFLIFRGFHVTFSVAVAVIVSAITVWGALPIHALASNNVLWEIVIFAGPGALMGGIIARRLALAMSPLKLKAFCSLWILLVGIVSL